MTDDRTGAEWQSLAGEYALGVLAGEELRHAQELERTDPQFRAEVSQWTGWLAPLLEEADEVPPPSRVWERLAESLSSPAPDSNVVQLRQRLKRWQRLASATTALAASLAVILLSDISHTPPPAPIQPRATAAPLVAMLGDPAGGTKVVASWNAAERQLVLAVPGDLQADPRHSHEMWVIPSDGKPRSLGTLGPSKQTHKQLAEALARLLEQGATIAISVEPAGGSPTGAPTGPVVAAGALTQA
jgi:anti-sigma-K factor RskA